MLITRERERERVAHAQSGQVDSSDSSESKNIDSNATKSKQQNKNIAKLALVESTQDFDSPTTQATQTTKQYEKPQKDTSQTITERDLGRIVAYGSPDVKSSSTAKYQSNAGVISKSMIQTHPSGNGDIGSILRLLPNVQFDNAQNRSTAQGEIDPANISISGGLYYQNNFQIDGLNINNDLDPHGEVNNNINTLRGGQNQGFAIDTSLLEGIVVQDSNISAAYGRFSGGVIEATVRKPRRNAGGINGWRANISYQFTSSDLTEYHLDKSSEEYFYASASEAYQPNFHKHIIRASTEGYITDKVGLVASFNTTQSFIPLKSYPQTTAANTAYIGTEVGGTRQQKRQSYNFYTKMNYDITENLTLEAYLGYMPQTNTYFTNNAKDSFYQMDSGGIQSGLKASLQTPIGFWLNSLGYTRIENSRRSDKNYYISWYGSSIHNWAYTNATTGNSGRAIEGGYGDLDTLQDTLTLKSDFTFNPLSWGIFDNVFRIGTEINYQKVQRNRLEDVYFTSGLPRNTNGSTCYKDQFGIGQDFCSVGDTFTTGTTQANAKWSGQYFNALQVYQAGKTSLDSVSYGVFAEDDMKLDLNFERVKIGELNARIGVRLDGDDYMSKHTIAPRFSLGYITPIAKAYQTTLTFGANRYYGRNLFSYRLYDNEQNLRKNYTRTSSNQAFVESSTTNNSTYKFNKLKVPYDDELMGAISQNLSYAQIAFKYIYRQGRDEIMRRSRTNSNGLPSLEGYSNNYTIWTNDGSSQSHIFSLIIKNIKPILTYGVAHNYLFAFDYTRTSRTYNLLSADEAYYNDTLIKYNGEIINYRNRPVENWARPFTLRLDTTHAFKIAKTKWVWNNFFRFRAGYDRMVILTRTDPRYDSSFSGSQYGKMRFPNAFSWDMRLGFELDMYKGQTLYMNVDIYNVLNSKIKSTIANTAYNGSTSSGAFASSNAVAVYEVGRQFWLQVGYKF
ncbi:Plug domain-containing protein [Helicobacter sp. MIT 01-3238]|uniref:Plug domain-containing protein n=1 Tax=Helicobacter sp. MIT 01-3238 TaxID=398627 RepID=UPI002163E72F|nr:Plug domain-containing protein [Helicobacter sp. MIT 01-3238]